MYPKPSASQENTLSLYEKNIESIFIPAGGNIDKLVKSIGWLSQKIRYTRRGVFLGARPYMWYAERAEKYYNAVDRIFYDAIKLYNVSLKLLSMHLSWLAMGKISQGRRASPDDFTIIAYGIL